MLKKIAHFLIQRSEQRIKVKFDYIHKIADTDMGLLLRYNKIFGFLDPNKKVPPLAYHAARLRGAIAADCGSCVEAEINLAKNAGIEPSVIDQILAGQYSNLSREIVGVVQLSDAVMREQVDDAEARDIVRMAFGEAGLIEISFAMNGAALLPGIRRAMGYATHCDIDIMRKLVKQSM